MEGKGSLLHQSVQKHIYDLLPHGEAFIEYRLPGHVTDLLWLPKKIAFEIQVSPISIDTAVTRTADYKKMGLFIVWILHQKSFNSAYLTLAELFLRKHPNCYYTNISTTAHGYIYDQTELLRNNKREERGNPSFLDLEKPLIKWGHLSFKGDRNQNFLTKSLQTCYTRFSPIVLVLFILAPQI